MPFRTFHFDCNSGFGIIDSPRKWRWLLSNTNASYSVPDLLRARLCDPASGIPEDVPHFGFRMENQGTRTLGEWSQAQGMDLLTDALAPNLTEELRRRGVEVGPFLTRYHSFRGELMQVVNRYNNQLLPMLLDVLDDGNESRFPDLTAWAEYELFIPQMRQELADKAFPA